MRLSLSLAEMGVNFDLLIVDLRLETGIWRVEIITISSSCINPVVQLYE